MVEPMGKVMSGGKRSTAVVVPCSLAYDISRTSNTRATRLSTARQGMGHLRVEVKGTVRVEHNDILAFTRTWVGGTRRGQYWRHAGKRDVGGAARGRVCVCTKVEEVARFADLVAALARGGRESGLRRGCAEDGGFERVREDRKPLAGAASVGYGRAPRTVRELGAAVDTHASRALGQPWYARGLPVRSSTISEPPTLECKALPQIERYEDREQEASDRGEEEGEDEHSNVCDALPAPLAGEQGEVRSKYGKEHEEENLKNRVEERPARRERPAASERLSRRQGQQANPNAGRGKTGLAGRHTAISDSLLPYAARNGATASERSKRASRAERSTMMGDLGAP
eukprot:scaffold103776_cov27-Tisochrysis_lutea.AAC.3